MKLKEIRIFLLVLLQFFFWHWAVCSTIVITQEDLEQYEKSQKKTNELPTEYSDIVDTNTRILYNSVVLVRCRNYISRPTIDKLEVLLGESFEAVSYYLNRPFYSFGTGFFIGGEGHICTNRHVVEGWINYSTLPTGKKLKIEYIFDSVEVIVNPGTDKEEVLHSFVYTTADDLDLAILQCAHEPRYTLDISDCKIPRRGEKITICGFPKGRKPQDVLKNLLEDKQLIEEYAEFPEPSLNIGSVTALRRDKNKEIDLIQLDIRANPGNSGGPAVDSKNKFVGIITWRMPGAVSMDYIIPASKVIEFIKENLPDLITENKTH